MVRVSGGLQGNRKTQVDHAAGGDTTHTYSYPQSGQAGAHTVSSVTNAGPSGTTTDTYKYNTAGETTSRPDGGKTQTLSWALRGDPLR